MLDAIYLLLTLTGFVALAALLGPLARFVDNGPPGRDEGAEEPDEQTAGAR